MKRFRWLVALLLALALVASSCGDDDDATGTDDGTTEPTATVPAGTTPEPTATAVPLDYDPEGVLRVASFMDRLNMVIDETSGFGTVTHDGIVAQILGSPLIPGRDGSIQPWLAESFEVVDPMTMKLTLREGLTFHDGAPYDAQTLADAWMGYKKLGEDNPAITNFNATVLKNIVSIDVEGTTGLTFNLDAPVAGLLPANLASALGYVASPGSNPPETVYGAGPYKMVDFELDDHLTAEKWDDFFDADSYLLGGIEWINLNKIESAQNGLLDDQVDLIATNPRDIDSLLSQGPFEKVVTNNQGHYMLAVCSTKPPFDDPKVREAFDLAINRDQINDVVLGGNGAAMESLWDPTSPLNVPGLIDTDGDIDAAKALLAEVNWDESTEITLGVYPGFQTHELIAETISGQVAKAGFNAKVTVMEGYDVASFSGQGGLHVVANINPGIQAVTVPGGGASLAWNPCGYSSPELTALTDQITAGDLTGADQVDVWKQIQEYVVGNHLWFVLDTQPAAYVYNSDRVQGLQPGTIGLTGATQPSPYLDGVSIKAG